KSGGPSGYSSKNSTPPGQPAGREVDGTDACSRTPLSERGSYVGSPASRADQRGAGPRAGGHRLGQFVPAASCHYPHVVAARFAPTGDAADLATAGRAARP